jgi:hypothetical protein
MNTYNSQLVRRGGKRIMIGVQPKQKCEILSIKKGTEKKTYKAKELRHGSSDSPLPMRHETLSSISSTAKNQKNFSGKQTFALKEAKG